MMLGGIPAGMPDWLGGPYAVKYLWQGSRTLSSFSLTIDAKLGLFVLDLDLDADLDLGSMTPRSSILWSIS